MLNLDLNRHMENRDIQEPRRFLVDSGFSYHTAGRLLKNQLPGLRNLEKLCVVLNCTPNDLLNWTPDRNQKYPKNLELNKLSGRKSNGRITSKLRDLPQDKLALLHEFVNKLTDSE